MGDIEKDMNVSSNNHVSRLDILLPFSFVKTVMDLHTNRNNDFLLWDAKFSNANGEDDTHIESGILSQKVSLVNKDLLKLSINQLTLLPKDGCITCKVTEVYRNIDAGLGCISNKHDATKDILLDYGKFNQTCSVDVKICDDTCDVAGEDVCRENKETISNEEKKVEQTNDKTVTAIKRKRGRPKKSLSANREKVPSSSGSGYSESLILKDVKEDATSCNVSNAIPGKRYGLRGVKLSDKIMKAVKGCVELESDDENDSKLSLPSETQQQSLIGLNEQSEKENIEENIDSKRMTHDEDDLEKEYIPDQTVELDNDENQEDENSDEEFSPTPKRKRGRPRKLLVGGSMTDNKVSDHRVRKKIDLGENVPKFERRIRNKQRDAICKYCKKAYCDYTGVDSHVKKWHSKEPDVDEYMKVIEELKICKCSECGEQFSDRFLKQVHENRVHFRGRDLKCFKCNKTYKNAQSLRIHMSAVHNTNGQLHLCHLCPAKFKWALTLRQHIEEIHENKMPFACKICNKKFGRKTQVTKHERIHGLDPSKRLVCPKCGKGFWYDCNYQRHMKLVHGPHEENYHCSYCGKGFNMKTAMVSHVQHVHLNIYPFRCTQCKVGFRRKKLLEDHLSDVHKIQNVQVINNHNRRFKYHRNSEDLFYCSHCSLSFCYKTKMIEHMHIDHGKEFPYVCEHCCQGFLAKNYLVNHLQQAHSVKSDDPALISLLDEEDDMEGKRGQIVTVNLGSCLDQEVSTDALETEQVFEDAQDSNISVLEISEQGEITSSVVETEEAASVLLEVASGNNTIHYLIEQPADGSPAVIPQELSNLLLAAEHSLQLSESGEIQLAPMEVDVTTGEELTYVTQDIEETIIESVEMDQEEIPQDMQ